MRMEGTDDDFGDIYADVEAQATSAVNSVPDFTRPYIEPEDKDNNEDGNNQMKDVNLTGGDESGWSGDGGPNEKALEMEGSDSEDDLNIVLNEDDCQMFHNKGVATTRSGGGLGASDDEDGDDYFGFEQESAGHTGDRGNVAKGSYHSTFSQYKYIRPHGAVQSSIAKGNRLPGAASISSMLTRGDWEDNKFNQHKGLSSGQVAYPCSTDISGAAQSGYGFSLPWYRTILDVDIESFEHKPWRHPGADVTDFFNFGLVEKSWKTYCESLELIRQQTLSRTKKAVYDSKPNQGYEAEFESGKVAQEGVGGKIVEAEPGRMVSPESKPADRGVRQLLPRGRAIRVEGSTCERLPSTDVKRPRSRDSGVVIQVIVQDSMEHSSGSQKGEASHMDTNAHDTSESGDFSVDNNMDSQSLSTGDGGELSMGSMDRNVGRLESKRCPKLETASGIMTMNLADSGTNQITDMGGCHCQQHVCTSYSDADVIETVNNTHEEVSRNAFDVIPCIMETGSSDGDETERVPISPHGSQSDASEYGVHGDPGKFPNPTRKSSLISLADYQESGTSGFYLSKDSKSKDVKMKTGGCENSLLKNNSLPRGKQTRGCRLSSVAKIHADTNNARRTSDREGRNSSSNNHMRRKVKMDDVGPNSRRGISNHHEIEAGLLHWGDRFAQNHVQTYTRKLRRKDHQSCRDESAPYFRKKWDEQEYFLEERIARADKKVERDGYHHRREPAMKDMSPHTYRESRFTTSKYQSYTDKERDTWCREKDDLHLRKRFDNDDTIFECGHSYDLRQDKYGRSIPFTDGERGLRGKNYERHPTSTGREDFDRWERCASISSLDLDDSVSRRIKDGYWRQGDYQSLSSRSYREPHTLNAGSWHDMSPRDDARDSKLAELYGRGRRQLCTERFRENDQFDSHNDVYKHEDSIICTDEQVCFGKRRYNWQSKELSLAEDEFICRHQGDESYAEEAPYYYENISKHENNYPKHDSANVEMPTGEKQLDRPRRKMTRERSNNGRNSNVVRRGKLEQTVLRCRDPVDLVLGEGKSSGRRFKDETLICSGKLGSVDDRSNRAELTFEDFEKAHAWKAAETDITEAQNGHNSEKWLDKFPVTEHNESFDLEEGQIVTEERDKGVIFERRDTPESAAPTSCAEEKPLQKKTSADANKAAGEIDSHRILEMRAKMEKRRERFKEPITAKKERITAEPDQCPNPQVDPIVEPHESKQRPARKRRWAGT